VLAPSCEAPTLRTVPAGSVGQTLTDAQRNRGTLERKPDPDPCRRCRGLTREPFMPRTSTGTRQVSGGGGSRIAGRRHGDLELWRDVNKTIIGLTSVVQIFAKRVRRADRLELAKERIDHSDELAERAERQTDEVAVARLEGRA
jgi:hypothetical protein